MKKDERKSEQRNKHRKESEKRDFSSGKVLSKHLLITIKQVLFPLESQHESESK